jgi:hypothetical protein
VGNWERRPGKEISATRKILLKTLSEQGLEKESHLHPLRKVLMAVAEPPIRNITNHFIISSAINVVQKQLDWICYTEEIPKPIANAQAMPFLHCYPVDFEGRVVMTFQNTVSRVLFRSSNSTSYICISTFPKSAQPPGDHIL